MKKLLIAMMLLLSVSFVLSSCTRDTVEDALQDAYEKEYEKTSEELEDLLNNF